MIVIQEAPYVEYKNEHGKLIFHSGLEVEILKTLSRTFNFTYSIIDCGQVWGTRMQDDNWTGVIGLLDKKVDLIEGWPRSHHLILN